MPAVPQALALRVSMEEERARQAAAAAAAAQQAGGEGGAAAEGATGEAAAGASGAASTCIYSSMMLSCWYRQPLLISCEAEWGLVVHYPPQTLSAAPPAEAEGMAIDAMDEDALLQQALALSMQVDQPATTPAPAAGEGWGAASKACCAPLTLGLDLPGTSWPLPASCGVPLQPPPPRLRPLASRRARVGAQVRPALARMRPWRTWRSTTRRCAWGSRLCAACLLLGVGLWWNGRAALDGWTCRGSARCRQIGARSTAGPC